MKKISTVFAGLALVAVATGLFFSCEIGLGQSVDTKAPSVTISSPAVDSVIAGTFTVTGGATDDTSLKSVSLSLKETTSGSSFGPYDATIDASAHTWSCALNTTDSAGKFTIADGKYQITATATDSVGRTSVATTVYQIDNVNPTVMATSPLTYGSDGCTTFYRTIDIKGEVYDASTIKEVVVILRSSAGAELARKTADGTNTWSVRFDYSSGSGPLSDGDAYYYDVIATDAAGNQNAYFFHRSDIYPLLSKGADGYVTFPSMNQIGKVDQGLSASTDNALTSTKLATIRHGASSSAAQSFPDFVFKSTDSPKVQWLNISGPSSAIGVGVDVVGSILPPSDNSFIKKESVSFVITNLSTYASYKKDFSSASLSDVSSSLNFNVPMTDDAGNDLASGSYNIAISFSTKSSMTGSASEGFTISSGVPSLSETTLAGTTNPTFYTKSVKSKSSLGGYALGSDKTITGLTLSWVDSFDSSKGTIPLATNGAYTYDFVVDATKPANDGTHTLTLTADAGGGNSTFLTRVLVVDTQAPSLEFQNPTKDLVVSPADEAATTIKVSGSADDGTGSGITAVYYLVDAKGIDHKDDDYATNWTLATGTVSWSGTPSIATMAEGKKTLWVAAVDAAGNVARKSVDFTFDKTYPTATIEVGATAHGYSDSSSGTIMREDEFTLSGNCSDTSGAVTASLTAIKDGTNFGTLTLTSQDVGAGTWTYKQPVDRTNAHANDGLYIYTLTVTDAAGKASSKSATVRVDTTPPSLSVVTPASDAIAMSSPYKIQGSAYDLGAGIDTATAIAYDFSGEATAVTNGALAMTSGSSWSKDLSLSLQGAKTVKIYAVDLLGNKTDSGEITFYYDTEPPKITEAYDKTDTIYEAAGFNLSGTVSDSNAIASLTVTQVKDGGTAYTIYSDTALSGKSALYDVSSTGVALPRDPTNAATALTKPLTGSAADGLYQYVLTVTDVAGRSSSVTRTIRIDSTPPAMCDPSSITINGANTVNDLVTYYSGAVSFSGTASDSGSGVAKVQYSTSAAGPWTDANGSTNWSTSLNLSAESEGEYTLYFQAIDKRGLVSAPSASVKIQLDHNDPRAELNAPDSLVALDGASGLLGTNDSFTLSGIADDNGYKPTLSPVRAAKKATLSWTKDGTAAGSVALAPQSSDGKWNQPFDIASLSDGLYIFTLTVKDIAGKEKTAQKIIRVDTTAPTLTIAAPAANSLSTGENFEIKGSVTDFGSGVATGDAIDSVSYVLQNGSAAADSPATTKVSSSGWAKTVKFSSEGKKTLTVTAKDKVGNSTTAEPVVFYYDIDPPTLTVDNPSTLQYATAASVKFTGTWKESNELRDIVISYSKDGGSAKTLKTITPAEALKKSATPVAWDSETCVLPDGDGSYAFTIAATDVAGRTDAETRTIIVDTAIPTVIIESPSATDKYFDYSLAASGTASDGDSSVTRSGLDYVEYSFDPSATVWTKVSGTSVWNKTISIPAADYAVGSHTLYVRAVDKAGNKSATQPANFTIDRAAPTIAEVNYVGTVYKNATFTVALTMTDDLGFGSTGKMSASLSGPTGSSVGALVLNTGDTNTSKAYTYTQPVADGVDGTYTITFTAVDSVGRESVITRSVIVDTTEPAMSDLKYTLKGVTKDITDLSSGWLASTSAGISGKASDAGSGVSLVEYFVTTTDTAPSDTATGSAFSGAEAFNGTVTFTDNSSNYLYIRVTDRAGNKSVSSGIKVQVDTIAPTISALTSVPAIVYSNGSRASSLNVSFSASDSDGGSGAFLAVAKVGNGDVTTGTTYPSIATATSNIASDNSATISGISLSGITANTTVYVKVRDVAGNWSAATPVNVTFDNTPPTVDIKSPVPPVETELAAVNKTVSISGTANDTTGLASVKVMVLKAKTSVNAADFVAGHVYRIASLGSTDTAFTAIGANANTVGTTFVATGPGTGGGTAYEWTDATVQAGTVLSGTYNWTLTGFNTANATAWPQADYDASGDAGYQLRIGAVATDVAGNVTCADRLVTVDQDSDRPVITFNNISLKDMSSTNVIWLKQANVLYGTITDDDGVKGMRVSEQVVGKTDIVWKDVPVSNGSWTYTLSDDASYILKFEVTDKAEPTNGVFTAVSDTTAPGFDILTTPKLVDKDVTPNKFGYIDSAEKDKATAVYLTVDTKNPGVTTPEYYNGSAWDTAIAAQTFGGTRTSVRLHQYAYDANGIASVKITLDSNVSDASGAVYSYDAALQSDTTKVGDTTYSAYRADIDVSKLATGQRSMYITVTDKAGMITKTTVPLTIDNTAPTLTLDSHADNDQVSGSVTLKGTTGGSASELLYQVTLSAETPASWTVPMNGDIPDYTKAGAHRVLGAASSWRVNFDDDVNNSDGFTHDRLLKKYLVMLRSDLDISASGSVVYKGTETKFTDIVKLYFHFRATDAYGNTDSTICHVLKFDSQGDIPTVKVSYPALSSYGWYNGTACVYTKSQTPSAGATAFSDSAATGQSAGTVSSYDSASKSITVAGSTYTYFGGTTVMGGIIRVQGSAEDNKTIDGVYIQIDPTFNPLDGFRWDKDSAGNALVPGDEKLPDGTTKLSAKYSIVSFGKDGKLKGIKVGDGVSWSYSLNKDNEFNGLSGANNSIAIRAYAVDNDGNVSSLDLADDLVVTIDSAIPRIGSKHPLYLYQYDGAGNVTASQEYSAGMWLKGEWWLVGSIEDESGIETATIDGTVLTRINEWSGATSGFDFKYRIGSSTPDTFGSLSYTLNAEDKDKGGAKSATKVITVNYDNKAPVLAETTDHDYGISPTVVQSNGFYTLGSSVTETSTESASQSGFSRVAVYFLRRGSKAENQAVYDTYIKKGLAGNKLAIGADVTYDSGLYWKKVTVGRSSTNLMALTGVSDANVHTGGIVKIGGAIYRIANVSGTTVTISGSPAYSTSTETALFAIAQIVDHQLTESNGSTLGDNGYYSDVVNDDNDDMVEKVVTQGASSIWEANINSRNIPDGPIEIHYVAFDQAGNYSIGIVGNVTKATYSGDDKNEVSLYAYDSAKPSTVSNNAPRLAGVKYGTDDNGNGTVEDGELIAEMFAVDNYGAYKSSALQTSYKVNGGAAALNIKGVTKIVPEVVGGNGNLYYSYTVSSGGSVYYAKDAQQFLDGSGKAISGTDYSGTGAVSEIQGTAINLTYLDFLKDDAVTGSPEIKDGADQTFAFTIWDSTDESTVGTSSQHATVSMAMNVALRDATAPTVIMNPFYWNGKTDNSVDKTTSGSVTTLNGHIELAGSIIYAAGKATASTRTTPAVSGTVILAGTVNDNQRVNKIYLTIPDWNGGKRTLAATYNATDGTFTSSSDLAAGVTFSAATASFNNTSGHTVGWKLTWDTSSITGHAKAGETVTVEAEDLGAPSRTGTVVSYKNAKTSLTTDEPTASYKLVSTGDGFDKTRWYYVNNGSYTVVPVNATTFAALAAGGKLYTRTYTNKASYTMDVVPYITKVRTSLYTLKKNNWSVYNRTALGHYPAASTEKIQAYGFNLTDAKKNDTYGAYEEISLTDTTPSGEQSVTVNGVGSLNNTNDNEAEYNQQHNGDNNNLLTDDVVVDVWKINSGAVQSYGGGTIADPVMKINPNNNMVGFAFANGVDRFSMPNGTSNSYTVWQRNYADYGQVSFAFDSSGASHGIVIGHDTQPSNSYSGRMNYITSKWGVPLTDDGDNFYFYRKLRIESCGVPSGAYVNGATISSSIIDTTRFQSPSLAVARSGSTATLYLAYYDNIQKQIRFRWGTNSVASRNTVTTAATGFDQFYDPDTAAGRNGAGNNYGEHAVFESPIASYSLIAGGENTETIDSTGNTAGKYVAIDVIPGGTADTDIVVIVWYDGSDLKYIYRYGTKDDTNASSGAVDSKWSKPLTIFTDMGRYCAIAADKLGGVHIAAYDHNEGALKYAYLSSYDSTTVNECTVDSYGIVGNHISIDTALVSTGLTSPSPATVAVPYISYYMSSQEKPKLAYPAVTPASLAANHTPKGVNTDDDSFTGNWEVSMIPTTKTVIDDRINVGVWKDSNGIIAYSTKNGTATGTKGTSSPGSSTGTCYGNGTANPILGYAIEDGTTGYIETAQKQ